MLKKGVVNVTKDGTVCMWDLNGSGNSSVYCQAYLKLYPCNHLVRVHEFYFWILNEGKSSNDDPDDPDDPAPSLSPPVHTTMLQDENTAPSFVIIPNPNLGTFQIETNFPLSDIDNLKVVNPSGIPVYETQNLASNEIQLLNAGSGLYFVVIFLKDGTMLTQKMMLQR